MGCTELAEHYDAVEQKNLPWLCAGLTLRLRGKDLGYEQFSGCIQTFGQLSDDPLLKGLAIGYVVFRVARAKWCLCLLKVSELSQHTLA